MQRILLLLIIVLSAITASAQPFGGRWMTANGANGTDCLWFRRTFIAKERPYRAAVTVVADCRYVLYVNGRNVSTALYTPSDRRLPSCSTYDVTRFLCPDTNIVAVQTSPSLLRRESASLAVSFFGSDIMGERFAWSTEEGWASCHAGRWMTEEGETMDASEDIPHPAYGDMATALWQPAIPTEGYASASVHDNGVTAESMFGYSHHSYNTLTDNVQRAHTILRPRYFDIIDNHSVSYDFAPGFFGFVRVTLRGCRRGERIRIGNLLYVCSGEIDEQAFARFTPAFMRKITISGDRHFKPEQVQEVEGICL